MLRELATLVSGSLCVEARYILRATVTRPYGASTVQDVQFWVRNYEQHIEEVVPPIKVCLATSH